MNRVLFVSGPALGHISRLLSVAEQLDALSGFEIAFAAPQTTNQKDLVLDAGYHLHVLETGFGTCKGVDLEVFPSQLEALIDKLCPDLIVVDCNQLTWCAAMRWPAIPRILVTNVFLTRVSNYQTQQDMSFSRTRHAINTRRRMLNLKPINSPRDLYEADIVCLADPSACQSTHHCLPGSYDW